MVKKYFFSLSIVFAILILSGCGEIEEILGKVNQLLDSQTGESEPAQEATDSANEQLAEEEEDDESDHPVGENVVTTGTNMNDDIETPFDEQLLAQGYDNLTLPNGFALEMPYHWILVEDNSNDPNRENFVGTFCFNLPLEIEDIAETFNGNYTRQQEHFGLGNDIIHRTTLTADEDMMGGWEAVIEFFIDQHENTCANVELMFNYLEGGDSDGEYYGEDPSTMVSEEELAMFEAYESDEDEEGFDDSWDNPMNRIRHLADGYEDLLDELSGYENMEVINFDAAEVESVRQKIKSGQYTLLDQVKGFPEIFPYEWYLLKEEENFMAGEWQGTYCTDAQVKSTLLKHHSMLEALNADIYQFDLIASPNMYQISTVNFAFNDQFGTGSWSGSSTMYIDGTQDFQTHKCAIVNMSFSPDLLN